MKKVLAGGVFNIIHPGHIWFLERAKALGDCLVVVVANDRTVLKSKPLIRPQEERKRALENLGIADKVLIGDEGDFLKVVRKERPGIIALGYDQKFDAKELEALGCRVVRIPRFGSYSTRDILKKNKKDKQGQDFPARDNHQTSSSESPSSPSSPSSSSSGSSSSSHSLNMASTPRL